MKTSLNFENKIILLYFLLADNLFSFKINDEIYKRSFCFKDIMSYILIFHYI